MPVLTEREDRIFGLLSEKEQLGGGFSDRESNVFDLLNEKRGVPEEPAQPFSFNSPQPNTTDKRERVYFSDTGKMFDMPAGSSAILQDIHQDGAFDDPSSVFEETAATFKKQAAFLALIANAFGLVDDEDIADFIADRSTALVNAQRNAPEYMKRFQSDLEKANGFFESAAVFMSNPRALGRIIIAQTPNAILPMVTGLTGAGVGTAVGPAGTIVGFGVGIGTGTAIVETGAWMDQRMVERGIDMSDADQVLLVLHDEAFMNEIKAEAVRKGLAQGTVEALFAVFGASLLKRALPGTSIIQKTGRTAGNIAGETVTEGGGEAIGQLSARGVIDVKDVFLEAVSGLGQSAGTAAVTSTLAGKADTDDLSFENLKKLRKDTKALIARVEENIAEERKEEAAEIADKIAKGEAIDPDIISPEKVDEITEEALISVEAKALLDEIEQQAKDATLPEELNTIGLKEGRTRSNEAVENAVRRVVNGDPAPKDVAQKALHNKIVSLVKDRLGTPETQEAIIKGGVAQFEEKLVAVEREIDSLELLKSKSDKPSKALQNKIDKKKKEAAFLDSSIAELLIAEDKTVALKEAEKGDIKIKGEKVTKLTLKSEEAGIRRGLREGERATKQNIKQARKNIRDLINDSSLDQADKKAILALTKFENKDNFLKILPALREQITKAFDRTERKGLIQDIKDTLKKIKKAKNLAIDVVRQIEALVKDIDLVKRSQKTKDRLQKTLDFINNELEQGREVQMPKSVLNKLETLNKTPVEDLTNQDLQALLNQINILTDRAKLKLELRKSQKKSTMERRNADIKEDAVPFEEREARTPKEVRGVLGTADKIKNAWDRALNVAKRKFIAITPMDVVFDKMSKIGNYKGAIHRIFKQTIDRANVKFLEQEAIIKDRILNAIEELGIKESSYNPIGVMATLQQEGGREKLLANGYTDKELTKFEEEGLTKNEQKLLDMMREEFEKLKPQILDVMKRVYNKDFTSVVNYFPMLTDFKAMSDRQIRDMFGRDVTLIEDGVAFKKLTKDVEQGMTIERKGGSNKIKVDAVEVFLKHITNATYLINMAQDIRELGELAGSKEFGQSAGALGQEVTANWIDLLARQGGKEGYRVNMFDTMRKNVGWVVLGYKLSSALIQPTALLDGAALIGRYAFKGATNVALDANWRTFLKNNFVELQARIADDPAYREFMNNKSGKGTLGKVRRGSFYPLRTLDSITASAITAGAYEKIVTEKGGVVDFANPDVDAIQEATLLMRRTQSSGSFISAPSALTQGTFTGSVRADKLIFQFQSFMLNRWSLIQHDMIHNGVRLGQTQEALNIATWLSLALITEVAIRRGAEEIIAAATGTGDDLEDFEDVAIEKLAMETLRTVPLLGSVVSSLNYGTVPVPVISITQQAMKRFNIAIRTKDDKKKFKNAVRSVSLLAGIIGGIPGALQVDQIVRKAWDVKKTKSPKLPF